MIMFFTYIDTKGLKKRYIFWQYAVWTHTHTTHHTPHTTHTRTHAHAHAHAHARTHTHTIALCILNRNTDDMLFKLINNYYVLNCSVIFYYIHAIILVYVVNLNESILTDCMSVFELTYEETNTNK